MSDKPHQWQVILDRQPRKIMRRLPRDLLARLNRAFLSLAENPRPRGSRKLSGTEYDNMYRIRVGDWRISYAVEDDRLIVLVIEVATRGDAYRF